MGQPAETKCRVPGILMRVQLDDVVYYCSGNSQRIETNILAFSNIICIYIKKKKRKTAFLGLVCPNLICPNNIFGTCFARKCWIYSFIIGLC